MGLLSLFQSSPEAMPQIRGPPPESATIFGTIAAVLIALIAIQKAAPGAERRWLPAPGEKRAYEVWVLKYSVVWMGIFGTVVATQVYERFDALGYFLLCGGLAAPLALQPWVYPLDPSGIPTWAVDVHKTHAMRAQIWIAVFGFIGNYW